MQAGLSCAGDEILLVKHRVGADVAAAIAGKHPVPKGTLSRPEHSTWTGEQGGGTGGTHRRADASKSLLLNRRALFMPPVYDMEARRVLDAFVLRPVPLIFCTAITFCV